MKSTRQYYIEGSRATEIAASVEAGLREGELAPGQQLPTVRWLAADLGLSPVTVAAAYRLLRQRGLITTHRRRGTTISLGPALATRGPVQVFNDVRNLADGSPDRALLPSLKTALTRVNPVPQLYGEQPALPQLMELAEQQLKEDGIPTAALTLVGGAMDAFERVLRAETTRGQRVAIEDPGHANLLDLIGALGLEPEPIRVDDRGPIPDDLERAFRRGVRAVIITPRAQNPTGAALDRQRVEDLAAVLAGRSDTLWIEDDHSAKVSGAPAQTLVTRGPARWVVIRSVSKALGPDLRLAVVAGDARTIARVEGQRLVGAGWVSGVLQQLVLGLWSDPDVERLIQRAADTYRERRQALLDSLEAAGIAAHGRSGLNVWVPVAEERTPARLLLESGWAISPGERFRIVSPPALRITITSLDVNEAPLLAEDLLRALEPVRRVYGA